MYVATPPSLSNRTRQGAVRLPLRLALAEHQVFTGGGGYADDDRTYFADLLTSYGIAYRDELLDARRATFKEMVQPLVGRLGSAGEGFDIGVHAHVTPDAEPGWPMCHLTDALPHLGLAFAVSDQGVVAPFTALRLVADITRVDGGRRALVVVMDQAARQHSEPIPDRLRADRNVSVALVLDESGGLGAVSVLHLVGIPETKVGVRLGAEARAAAADGGALTVVCGQGLTGHYGRLPADEVLSAPPGQPCTGVWSVVVESLPRWTAAGRRVLIADYDERLRYLCFCTVDVPKAGEVGE